MARHKHADVVWNLNTLPSGKVPNHDAQLAVLMDIRDELQALRRLAQCHRTPACIELGAEARAKKRRVAKKRKALK